MTDKHVVHNRQLIEVLRWLDPIRLTDPTCRNEFMQGHASNLQGNRSLLNRFHVEVTDSAKTHQIVRFGAKTAERNVIFHYFECYYFRYFFHDKATNDTTAMLPSWRHL